MAKNIFTDSLNNRELLDSFGVEQPLSPEELAQMSTQAPEVEPITKPITAPIPAARNTASQQTPQAPIVNTRDDLSMEAPETIMSKSETPEAPISKSEALLAEYQKMMGKDQEELKAARERDRMLKVGGALGDSLATIINARSQMNVKAPGVQVQQGAGLGEIAGMFATAPEIASDIAQRRQALMDQYKQLAIGESAAAKRELEKQRIQAMEEKNRLYGRQVEKMGAGREEAKQFREEKFEYDKIKNLQDSFNKDKQVVKAEERIQSAATLRDMIDGNPITQEAAKTFAARASGEVGALSDQDRAAYGGSKAIKDRINSIFTRAVTGELTDTDKKFMKELADKFEQAGQRDLQERLSVFSKQGTKRTKMSEDEVRETIRPDLALQKQQQTKPSLSPKDQQALDWANKNSKDPRAIEIKKRLGM